MKKFEDIMKNLGTSVQLSTREKNAMREKVHEYIGYKPVRDIKEKKTYNISFVSYRLTAVFVALALLFTSGIGITYASTNALPGDTLYVVKEMGEEITEFLILDDIKRAEYAVERVHKRLQEVEALSARGDLTPQTEALVMEKFEASSQHAEEHLVLLEESKPAQADALRIALAVGTQARTHTLAIHTGEKAESENNARTRIAAAIQKESRPSTDATPTLAAAPRVATLELQETHAEDLAFSDREEEGVVASMMAMPETQMERTAVASPPEKLVVLIRTLNKQKKALEDVRDDYEEGDKKEEIGKILSHITETQKAITQAVRLSEYAQAEELVRKALRAIHTTQAVIEANIEIEEVHILEQESEPVRVPQPLVEPEPLSPIDIEVRELPN